MLFILTNQRNVAIIAIDNTPSPERNFAMSSYMKYTVTGLRRIKYSESERYKVDKGPDVLPKVWNFKRWVSG